MSKQTNPDNYELREEYDLSKMPVVPKGRFAPEKRAGSNVVVLDADLAKAFPDDKSVNDALRKVLELSGIPKR